MRQRRVIINTDAKNEADDQFTGGSPAIALTLFPQSGNRRVRPAPRFGADGSYLPGSNHPIRGCEEVDVRFLPADMFAKIRAFGGEHH
ncbi:hypothetical protein AB0K18_04960 [Nonomuraea sp. NPDC049421]|uniref:hypothetical protein n=1 Tax=Nonomuraea sp. NPDC049421 TaxID=3155275 RepID=UPI0034344C7B